MPLADVPSRARKPARGPQNPRRATGREERRRDREGAGAPAQARREGPARRIAAALGAAAARLCAIADRAARTHERQARGEGRGGRSAGDRQPVAGRGPARSLPRLLEVHAGDSNDHDEARTRGCWLRSTGRRRACSAAAGTRAMTSSRSESPATVPRRAKAKRIGAASRSIYRTPRRFLKLKPAERASRARDVLDHKANATNCSTTGRSGADPTKAAAGRLDLLADPGRPRRRQDACRAPRRCANGSGPSRSSI